MNKLILPFVIVFLVNLVSCRTTENIESSSMVGNSKDSVSESYEDEQMDITIEYPSFSKPTTPPTTAPKSYEDSKSNSGTKNNTTKRLFIKVDNSLFPILPNSKITISKSSSKTKKDSVHNNNIVKDDKSIKPKKDNNELRQYDTLLVFFILFYCLVVSLRKKSSKKFGAN